MCHINHLKLLEGRAGFISDNRMQNPVSFALYLVIFRVIAIFLIKYLRTVIMRRKIENDSSLTLKRQKANI